MPQAGPVPTSQPNIYQTYQKLEALAQNSSAVVAFIDKASSAYYEENVLWRYGVRRFRPVPALRLPAPCVERPAAGSYVCSPPLFYDSMFPLSAAGPGLSAGGGPAPPQRGLPRRWCPRGLYTL